MAIVIKNNKIINCGTGISSPKDADVEIDDNSFVNCGTAIELREQPSFFLNLGLKEDTPIEMILQVLYLLRDEKVKKSDIDEKIKKVGLLDWISATANISTVASAFYELLTSQYLEKAIEWLVTIK